MTDYAASALKCPRCRSIMTYDKFYGPTPDDFWGWKCLMCGEIIDPVIMENRYLMRTSQGITGLREGVGVRSAYR